MKKVLICLFLLCPGLAKADTGYTLEYCIFDLRGVVKQLVETHKKLDQVRRVNRFQARQVLRLKQKCGFKCNPPRIAPGFKIGNKE